jgi:hypothetical protein
MSWTREFGEEYEVPGIITAALYDASWHNDSAPRFWRKDDPAAKTETNVDWPTYDLWVEHPDPEQRELGGKRFTVVKWIEGANGNKDTETIIETDDAAEALAAMQTLPAKWNTPPTAAESVVKQILGESAVTEDCARYEAMKKRVISHIDAADRAHHAGNDEAAAMQISGAISYLRAFTDPAAHKPNTVNFKEVPG